MLWLTKDIIYVSTIKELGVTKLLNSYAENILFFTFCSIENAIQNVNISCNISKYVTYNYNRNSHWPWLYTVKRMSTSFFIAFTRNIVAPQVIFTGDILITLDNCKYGNTDFWENPDLFLTRKANYIKLFSHLQWYYPFMKCKKWLE